MAGIFDPPPVDVAQLLQGLGQAPAPPPEADAAIAQTIQDLLAQMQVLPTQPELVQPEPLGGLQKVLLSLAGAGNAFAAGVNPQIQQQDFLSPVLNRRQGAADRANLTNQRRSDQEFRAQRAGLGAQLQVAMGEQQSIRADERAGDERGFRKELAGLNFDNQMLVLAQEHRNRLELIQAKGEAGPNPDLANQVTIQVSDMMRGDGQQPSIEEKLIVEVDPQRRFFLWKNTLERLRDMRSIRGLDERALNDIQAAIVKLMSLRRSLEIIDPREIQEAEVGAARQRGEMDRASSLERQEASRLRRESADPFRDLQDVRRRGGPTRR